MLCCALGDADSNSLAEIVRTRNSTLALRFRFAPLDERLLDFASQNLRSLNLVPGARAPSAPSLGTPLLTAMDHIEILIGLFTVSCQNVSPLVSLQLQDGESTQNRLPILLLYRFRAPSGNRTIASFPKVNSSCSLFQKSSSVAVPQCYDSDDKEMTAKDCIK